MQTERQIGSYEVLRIIGEGGMGRVYEVRHLQIGQRAAIKVLHGHLALHADIASRFLTEARASAAIDHPGIVKIFDFGRTDDESPYIVMEYLEGQSLARRIRELERMTVSDVLRYGREIAATLAAVHSKGVIHRDLKSDNIHIVPDPAVQGGERTKILDFGIAKMGPFMEARTDTPITGVGTIMGTPAYMAPEQCLGSEGVTGKADVYALGIVLYEMLTGNVPFAGNSLSELLYKQLTDVPPPLPPAIPLPLRKLIMRMLEKQADARPDMVYCAASLEQVASASPASAARTIALDEILVGASAPLASSKSSARSASAPPALPQGEIGPATRVPMLGADSPFGSPSWRDGPVALQSRSRSDQYEVLWSCLPQSMMKDARHIHDFLMGLFTFYEVVAPGVLHLAGRSLLGASTEGENCFVVFMAQARAERQPGLGTRTFAQYASPLEKHLAGLNSEAGQDKKIVLVITDSLELGRGVHAKIVSYHDRYRARVLPLTIIDVGRAGRSGARVLVTDKLRDLHDSGDPGAGARRDPLRFVGMRVLRHDVLDALHQGRLVAVSGTSTSGKSAVLNRIGYEFPDQRISRVPCRGISTPQELTKAIAAVVEHGSLRPPRASDESYLKALSELLDSATAAGPLMLCLDDVDGLIDVLANPSKQQEHRAALECWCRLGALIQPGRLSVLITAIRAFLLGEHQLAGRANPLRDQVYVQRMPGLTPPDVRVLVEQIGHEAGLLFSRRAMKKLQRLSAGHVGVLQRLCKALAERHVQEKRSMGGTLVTPAMVKEAAQDIASSPDAFLDHLVPNLGELERLMVGGIASAPWFLGQSHLLRRLCILAPDKQVKQSVDHLHKLGLVRRRGRLRVTIPLLKECALTPEALDKVTHDPRPLVLLMGGAGSLMLGAMWWARTAPLLRQALPTILDRALALGALLLLLGSMLWLFLGRRSGAGPLLMADRQESREAAKSPSDSWHDESSPARAPVSQPPSVKAPPQDLTIANVDMQRPVRVFLSYAPEDDALRKILEKHLQGHLRSNLLQLWHRHSIEPGREWSKEISDKLAEADLILLLVSPDFLSSEDCWRTELSQAMRRHHEGSARVVPILIRPSDWLNTNLGTLQALPRHGRPIASLQLPVDQDQAWVDVAQDLREMGKKLRAKLLSR